MRREGLVYWLAQNASGAMILLPLRVLPVCVMDGVLECCLWGVNADLLRLLIVVLVAREGALRVWMGVCSGALACSNGSCFVLPTSSAAPNNDCLKVEGIGVVGGAAAAVPSPRFGAC